MPTTVSYEVLFATNLRRLRNQNESGASANDVYTLNLWYFDWLLVNLLNPTGRVMHQQFNIQQLYALPTLYLCVLYLSENKQRLVPLTS